MRILSQFRWRVTLLLFGMVVFFGVLILVATLLGAGDPPRASVLWFEEDAEAFSMRQPPHDSTWTSDNFADIQPLYEDWFQMTLPFTVELQTRNTGSLDSAVGLGFIGVRCLGYENQFFLVRDDGYFSVSNEDAPDWTSFIHIQPDTNHLYLHINELETVTFRINGEIAWTGRIHNPTAFPPALLSTANAQFEIDYLRIYVGDSENRP